MEENNKKAVVESYDAATNRKNFDAAAKFLGPRYTRHNPAGGGRAGGLKAFLPSYVKIRRTITAHQTRLRGGRLRHLHNVPTPGGRGNAIVDIFKLENGKIVEHWDVRQEIPEQSSDSNTMF